MFFDEIALWMPCIVFIFQGRQFWHFDELMQEMIWLWGVSDLSCLSLYCYQKHKRYHSHTYSSRLGLHMHQVQNSYYYFPYSDACLHLILAMFLYTSEIHFWILCLTSVTSMYISPVRKVMEMRRAFLQQGASTWNELKKRWSSWIRRISKQYSSRLSSSFLCMCPTFQCHTAVCSHK